MEKKRFIEAINTYGAEKVNGRVRWAKNSRVRKSLMKAAETNGKIYYFNRTMVNGMRFESNISGEIRQFLIKCGIPYSSGNDAPRGGKTGDYFLVKLLG